MIIEEPVNKNYCATVERLGELYPLEGCDRLQGTHIFGNKVIVGIDHKEGDLGLFFPVETQFISNFLYFNNLYRDPLMNNDKTSKGMFDNHNRVRAIRLRGHRSEGLWLPIESLDYIVNLPKECLVPGTSFDSINGEKICRKYVPNQDQAKDVKNERRLSKKPSLINDIVDGQFRFHVDTAQLGRCFNQIPPTAVITITEKWHGTSAIIGNLLCKVKLPWYKKLAKFVGFKVETERYGIVWASRRVVKGVAGTAREGSDHFYGSDVWGQWAKIIGPKLPEGITIYGEIVGYTSEGQQIQKGYSYECKPSESRFMAYRATDTFAKGKVYELSYLALRGMCLELAIETLPMGWHSPVNIYTPEGTVEAAFKYIDYCTQGRLCPYNPGMPAEGFVISVEHGSSREFYKHKSFEFKQLETKANDKGEVDIETKESEE